MKLPAFPLPFARRASLALFGAALASTLVAADGPAVTTAPAASAGWNLPDFIDRLPDFLSERLPSLEPSGAVKLYVRPHFGDFLRRDFVRIPVGVRTKVTETFAYNAEVESYITHGLSDPAGYGLSRVQLGVKRERVLPSIAAGGISVGINYQSPLGRPPAELTDGHRHLQPYFSVTHALVPAWKVLGYAGITADFLDRTALTPHFGRNQLHSNSLTMGAGIAREWKRFQGSLTASIGSGSLVSDENEHVYALRPEIVVPWKSSTGSKTQVLFKLGGRAIHGPDGTEFGLSGSMRVEFKLRRGAK